MGPLLFLIYINDLPLNIQGAKWILYADGTNGLVIDRNKEALQTKLSLVMKQLEIWFLKNDLIINTTKTVAMSFHLCCSKPPFKPRILLRNKEIDYMPQAKFFSNVHYRKSKLASAYLFFMSQTEYNVFITKSL